MAARLNEVFLNQRRHGPLDRASFRLTSGQAEVHRHWRDVNVLFRGGKTGGADRTGRRERAARRKHDEERSLKGVLTSAISFLFLIIISIVPWADLELVSFME